MRSFSFHVYDITHSSYVSWPWKCKINEAEVIYFGRWIRNWFWLNNAKGGRIICFAVVAGIFTAETASGQIMCSVKQYENRTEEKICRFLFFFFNLFSQEQVLTSPLALTPIPVSNPRNRNPPWKNRCSVPSPGGAGRGGTRRRWPSPQVPNDPNGYLDRFQV